MNPRWGPNGTMLFNRTPRDTRRSNECGSILLVDTKTKEVTEWLRPKAVDGVEHLCSPDY